MTGRPGLGGAIITAGGLTFIGATDDARFRAFETKTGKEIWAVKLPAAAESTPITYGDSQGNQYVAVIATGGGLIGAPLLSDEVIVYSLKGNNIVNYASQAIPSTSGTSSSSYDTAVNSSDSVNLALLPQAPGRDLTIRVCSGCHSVKVIASHRRTPKEWNDMVQAMAGRGAVATDEEFGAISNYLTRAFPK